VARRGEEFVGGFSCWLGVLDEVAGVEDFDEGLCCARGGLFALVFGSLSCDSVEFAQDALGVGVVVPRDEVLEGDVELRGDGGGRVVGGEVGVEEVVLEVFGEGGGGRGSGAWAVGSGVGVGRGNARDDQCAERAQAAGALDWP
jgi:hypothetical protein